MYQARFTCETVSGYVLRFSVVEWTFPSLDLCDTVVKADSVTVRHPFSGVFWNGGSNLGDALGKQ